MVLMVRVDYRGVQVSCSLSELFTHDCLYHHIFIKNNDDIIINLIYIAQFDTNGIITALYIVITYIQM